MIRHSLAQSLDRWTVPTACINGDVWQTRLGPADWARGTERRTPDPPTKRYQTDLGLLHYTAFTPFFLVANLLSDFYLQGDSYFHYFPQEVDSFGDFAALATSRTRYLTLPQVLDITMEARRVHRTGYGTPTKPHKHILDKSSSKRHGIIPPSKRQRPVTTNSQSKPVIDLTGEHTSDEDDDDVVVVVTKAKKQNKPLSASSTREKRARRFRNHPPQSYLEKLDRARTQK